MAQPEAAVETTPCNCGAQMVRVAVEDVGRWGTEGTYVRVTGIPAWKCFRCGQVVYDHEVSHRVEALVRQGLEGADRMELMAVKVYRPAAREGRS